MSEEEDYIADRAFNQRILDAADDLLTDVVDLPCGEGEESDYIAVQTARLEELRKAIYAKFDATGR
jgi:hypothetical protein